jgi:hypothetical protein
MGSAVATTWEEACVVARLLHAHREDPHRGSTPGPPSADWLARALPNPRHESQHHPYLIRLLAFLLILAGIADKNRSRS